MEPKKKSKLGWWVAGAIGLISVVTLAGNGGSETVPDSQQSSLNSENSVESIEYQQAEERLSAKKIEAEKVDAEKKSTPAVTETTTRTKATQPTLSNDNYYTNSSGNTVHSPAYSSDSCAATGASATCRDGSCSFSQHRQGTCSHHGGVAEWH